MIATTPNNFLPKAKFLSSQQYIYISSALLLLGLLCCSSCKDPVDGCTDITATNWSAEADKSCENCCTYPKLKLTITHAYADTLFGTGRPYTDDIGNVYSVLSIRYYLSEMTLISGSGNLVIRDSISVSLVSGDSTERAQIGTDIILVTSGNKSYSIGSIRPNGDFIDSLRLYIGVADPFSQVLPSSVPVNHPLAPKTDSMYWDQDRGYIFQRLLIVPDTSIRDTVLLEIGGADFLQDITLPYGVAAEAGYDLDIPVRVDYSEWFKGINFAADSPEMMKEKIVSNIANSFSIVE